MYYVLVAIALIIVYSFLTRIISSLVKSCFVVVGLAAFVVLVYVMIISRDRPVKILDFLVVENFSIRKVQK